MRNNIVEEDVVYITAAMLPFEKFAGKNLLIAGANGFLPAYLVETFLSLNDKKLREKLKVWALVRNREKAEARFAHFRGRKDLQFIVQDVCEPLKLQANVDFIIHAASQASPKFYGRDPIGTISANTIGTNNLLNLAVEKKVESFLFLSSGEVYGEVSGENVPTREENFGYVNPADVRSCYAEGKRAGETLCVSWYYQRGVPVKIVRPFHTYGPGMSLDDGRVFADFVSDIVNNRDIVMKSDGSAVRAFCYSADATLGFLTVLLKGKDGEAYNVGNERCEISIRDLARTLVGLFPEKKLKVVQNEQGKPDGYIRSKIQRNCPNTEKLRGLGWNPIYSIEEGFRRTVRSYQ